MKYFLGGRVLLGSLFILFPLGDYASYEKIKGLVKKALVEVLIEDPNILF